MLEACVRNDFSITAALEVKELAKQESLHEKRTGKTHKMSKEKQEERREKKRSVKEGVAGKVTKPRRRVMRRIICNSGED